MSDLARELDQVGQLAASGRIPEALQLAQGLVARHPADAEANRLLGLCLVQTGQPERGLTHIRAAVDASPQTAELWGTLASVQVLLGRYEEAHAAAARAVELKPALHEAQALLATLLMQRGDLDGAERHYAEAIALKPDYAEAATNHAVVKLMTARAPEAVDLLRKAVRAAPTFPPAVTNFCMALNYVDGVDPEETLAAHKHFGAVLDMFPKPLPVPAQWPNARDPGKRLRVGLISPDFHAHSVAYFVLAILEHHDRAAVEYIGYSLNPKIDDMTRRLGPMMDGWRDVSKLADGPLVQQIRSDQCDIVVDLTGQTFGNRLAALRLRAAPVQVTYCGYPNTTGVPAIDWRFVDSITDPPGAERWATERLLRLDPCFLCYTGDPAAAHDDEPPSVANGFVTFGSFNSIKKVTPRVLELWAQVLHAVPRSRLVIKSPGIQARSARLAISSALKQAGIPEIRFDLVERIDDTADHLRAYNAIDVALDTFPYNGTTTTCEAMWMGVPVVTRTGATHASRVSASLLSAIGLPELSASDDQAFVATASALATDAPRLAEFRRTLRQRMLASPLCDRRAFASRFEAALRTVWRAHLGT